MRWAIRCDYGMPWFRGPGTMTWTTVEYRTTFSSKLEATEMLGRIREAYSSSTKVLRFWLVRVGARDRLPTKERLIRQLSKLIEIVKELPE